MNFSEQDLFLFHQGTNYHAYRMLGAHHIDGGTVRFAVWAPEARAISVVGDFNDWDASRNPMTRGSDGEIWTAIVNALPPEANYKYSIETQAGERILKSDPYAFYAEVRPNTASKVHEFKYEWHDQSWYDKQREAEYSGGSYARPMLIYEVHLGSWKRAPGGGFISYRQMADELVDYAVKMHYTHLETMPLCEHPLDMSWGYQATGYYAVTSRYGKPEDFMYLVDRAHQHGIGVIMDWVPGHFCNNAEGLRLFDGRNLYESDNTQRAENKGWGTTNFDYGRTEVKSFLISNAMFWLEEYHIDGLRIDAVANMLYLNYGREAGEWVPNKYGGTGNLEAMDFLKQLNLAVFGAHHNALMIAEESTDWPLVSRPIESGGMGFNYKWNMGWMNDTLKYMSLDPIYRKWNQDKITFSLMYAFSENFVLPLSHDEVVHGKCSLINKMPGDYWQKFAGLRAFFAYWLAHPGKKLLFMGGEFGQFIEWNEADSLDWHLVEQYDKHREMQRCSQALNEFYVNEPAFWQVDFDWGGFEWIDCSDTDHSMVAFVRKPKNPVNKDAVDEVIVVCNFTPEVHNDYRIGVPRPGKYVEVFNTDAREFGGSGVLNGGELIAEAVPWHHRPQSLTLTVPPLAVVYLKPVGESAPQ